jgi:WD40 repeat protein
MRCFDLPGKRVEPDALLFSQDSRYLVIQAFGCVDILDTITGAMRPISPGYYTKRGTAGVGFTANSRGVVYFKIEDSSVRVFDLDRGQDRVLRQNRVVPWRPSGDVELSAIHPAGQLVFVAVSPSERTLEVVALDTSSGEQKFFFGRHKSFLRELVVSPDGQWVAGCAAKDLRVWYIGGRKLSNRASWHLKDLEQYDFGRLALARDGAFLAAGGFSGRAPVRVWDLKGGTELHLDRWHVGGLAFAPDRPLLAFTDHTKGTGEVVFWDAERRAELKRFDWDRGPMEAVAFSPDGFCCATANRTKAVVWDVDV